MGDGKTENVKSFWREKSPQEISCLCGHRRCSFHVGGISACICDTACRNTPDVSTDVTRSIHPMHHTDTQIWFEDTWIFVPSLVVAIRCCSSATSFPISVHQIYLSKDGRVGLVIIFSYSPLACFFIYCTIL